MAKSTSSLARRAFLFSATVVVTLSTGLATTGSATGAPGRATPAPETVPLPEGIRPEGITSGPGTTYYVGSLADGRIVTGDLLDQTSRVLLPGQTGRAVRGLLWDSRSNLVWAAGNEGAQAHVYAVDAGSGAIVSDTLVENGKFLNDLVVTDDAVWVTDSRVDQLTRIAVGPDGSPTGAVTFVALVGAWPAGDGAAINANGIRELADGSLVLNNTRAGGLWQVDPGTGTTSQIPVSGGPGIVGGDGLELDGTTLYNVRGSGPNQVAVLRLARSDSGWQAKWLGARTDETLDVPTTATVAGGWLWTVNARFTTPGATEFWITRLPALR